MSVVCIGVVWHSLKTGANVSGTINWASNDPLRLVLIFNDLDGEHEWLVARDVIADALRDGNAGEGDVRARCSFAKFTDWPLELPALILELDGTDGQCELATRLDAVIQFASEIYGLVPRGEEAIDVDEFIRELNL